MKYLGNASITSSLVICQEYISPHSLEHPRRSRKWNSQHRFHPYAKSSCGKLLQKGHKIWTPQPTITSQLEGASSGQSHDPAAPLNEGKAGIMDKRQVAFNHRAFGMEKHGGDSHGVFLGGLARLRFRFHTPAPPMFPRTLGSNEFPSLHSPDTNHELYSEICLQRQRSGKV